MMALSIGWVMWVWLGGWGGGPISYGGREVYRVANSDATGPRLTLSSMRHVHIMPQLGVIARNAHGILRDLDLPYASYLIHPYCGIIWTGRMPDRVRPALSH